MLRTRGSFSREIYFGVLFKDLKQYNVEYEEGTIVPIFLERNRGIPKKILINIFRSIFFQIASAMHFISEKGILHLDLATRNVLLTHPHEVAKISDFGLSKFMSEIEPDEKFGSRGEEKYKFN